MYSEDNASLPDGVDRNVYVPTGFYKVRPCFVSILPLNYHACALSILSSM